MLQLLNKMLRSFILLLLATVVIVYFVFISTDFFYYTNKFNFSVMSQSIIEYFRSVITTKSFGMSVQYTSLPVNEVVAERYENSLKIIIPAFIISVVVGILLGIHHFLVRERKIQSRLQRINHLLFGTVPDFFLLIAIQYGLILLIRANLIELKLFGDDTLFNLLFPIVIISITPTFFISNITYHSLVTESERDYVRTAMSKGSSQFSLLKHLLWNAWPTILGYTQTLMVIIISSLPIIERLCFFRGAGQQLIMSIKGNDTTVVIGLLMPFLLLVLLTLWITDIIKLFIARSSLEHELSGVTITANRFQRMYEFIKILPSKTIKNIYSLIVVLPFKTIKILLAIILFPFKAVTWLLAKIVTIPYINVGKRLFGIVRSTSFRRMFKTIFVFMKEYPSFILGTFILGGIACIAIFGPMMPFVDNELVGFRVGYDEDGNLLKAPLPPGDDYWLGTNREGRDLFSIVIHGARETFLQLFVIITIRFLISIPLGYFSSIHKGARNLLGFSNSLLSFLPTLIIVMLIGHIPPIQESGGRYVVLIIAIALIDVGRIGEIMRQEFTKINKTEYLLAAVATGTTWYNMIIRHYIPNIYQKIVYITISDMARIMVLLGGLGIVDVFLAQELSWDPEIGITIDNLTYTWASLLSDAIKDIQTAPWIPFFPALCIAITIMGLNLVGAGLKDFMDHQKKLRHQKEVRALSQDFHNEAKQWETNHSKGNVSI
ncbi:ABC-type dipeptide/oligopeptide/nickel transport system permease subunit [Bacillus mesophilus]|uniref:ABC transporter permease subunit n=1 Tax=Bacillus mesophilus TaxID=1808955 RepID=A0A6M0QEK1_9BACI|nr:ABC transporter permease subunit [Bacillus mesophilus]MBM7660083.1 ABC-type dipeptide/oligopeptide/nickel transport system permease subunit [Bacillus mesophilus]NEY73738.1 ABC transporter permease subunit [Bacillus mesophilus]